MELTPKIAKKEGGISSTKSPRLTQAQRNGQVATNALNKDNLVSKIPILLDRETVQ